MIRFRDQFGWITSVSKVNGSVHRTGPAWDDEDLLLFPEKLKGFNIQKNSNGSVDIFVEDSDGFETFLGESKDEKSRKMIAVANGLISKRKKK